MSRSRGLTAAKDAAGEDDYAGGALGSRLQLISFVR
jgi:hypothetical protein